MVASNRKTEEFRVSPSLLAFHPKATRKQPSRQVFWLAQSFATFPFEKYEQWHKSKRL
jgi:hypothetical protein